MSENNEKILSIKHILEYLLYEYIYMMLNLEVVSWKSTYTSVYPQYTCIKVSVRKKDIATTKLVVMCLMMIQCVCAYNINYIDIEDNLYRNSNWIHFYHYQNQKNMLAPARALHVVF